MIYPSKPYSKYYGFCLPGFRALSFGSRFRLRVPVRLVYRLWVLFKVS